MRTMTRYWGAAIAILSLTLLLLGVFLIGCYLAGLKGLGPI